MQRADKRKFHYIYKITRDDGKYYIGMHSTDHLDDGYFGSGKLITRSIKKHGVERHKKEILEFLPSRIQMKERERQLVDEEILDDPKCMNLVLGGNGGCTDESQKARSSAGGKNPGKSAKGSIIAKNAALKAAETKRRLVEQGLTEAWHPTFQGLTHSEETKAQVRATRVLRQCGVGEKNSQFGSCWVTDGVKPIKIKKECLGDYLKTGYRQGRKQLNQP